MTRQQIIDSSSLRLQEAGLTIMFCSHWLVHSCMVCTTIQSTAKIVAFWEPDYMPSPQSLFFSQAWPASFPVSSQLNSVREKSHNRADFRFKPQTSKGKHHCPASLPHFPNGSAFSACEAELSLFPSKLQYLSLLSPRPVALHQSLPGLCH